MQEKVATLQKGETLLISQPLGTGKTFLVNHMISERRLDVPRGVSFLTAKGLAEDPKSAEQFPGEVLTVDETDIKTAYKKLSAGMENLQKYLDRTNKKAIVIGDFSLRDVKLQGLLHNPTLLLNFEPIDRAFLQGTTLQRFEEFMPSRMAV